MGTAIQDSSVLDRSGITEVTFIEKYVELLDAEAAVEEALRLDNPDFLMLDAEDGDARQIAQTLLSRVPVIDAINARLMEAVQSQRLTTAQWVLDSTRVVFEKCMQAAPIIDARTGKEVIGKFQPVAALRALELIGKHVDIQAFKETLELEVGPNLANAMDNARKRVEANAQRLIEGEYEDAPEPQDHQRTLEQIDSEVSEAYSE